MTANPSPADVREALASLLYGIWSTEISSDDAAAAILARLPSLGFVQAPAGWRVVPEQPTEAMVEAAARVMFAKDWATHDQFSTRRPATSKVKAALTAALAAAPTPPAQEADHGR